MLLLLSSLFSEYCIILLSEDMRNEFELIYLQSSTHTLHRDSQGFLLCLYSDTGALTLRDALVLKFLLHWPHFPTSLEIPKLVLWFLKWIKLWTEVSRESPKLSSIFLSFRFLSKLCQHIHPQCGNEVYSRRSRTIEMVSIAWQQKHPAVAIAL